MAKINQALRQPTSDDLVAELLDFLRRKFYQAHPVTFAKDRPRLLKWVMLWPAAWLNKRGVTVPAARYREIFMSVFMDGLRFGQVEKITYLPAYLAKIIQSHFDHHGDELYDEAKSMRNLTENAVAVAGRAVQNAPDPVRTLADAARLPKTQAAPLQTARQGPTRPPVNPQFNPLSQFNKLACKAPKSVSNLCERPGCPQKPCHLAIFHARLHNPLINGLFRTVSP